MERVIQSQDFDFVGSYSLDFVGCEVMMGPWQWRIVAWSVQLFYPHVFSYWPCGLLLTWKIQNEDSLPSSIDLRVFDLAAFGFPFSPLYIYIYILLFFSTQLIKFITWGLSVIFQTFLLFPTSSIYSFLFFMPFHFWQKFGRFNSFLRFFVFFFLKKKTSFLSIQNYIPNLYILSIKS